MQADENLYDSKYLNEKYKIKISKMYGIILEDLSVGGLKIQDENMLSCLGLKNLQQYFEKNRDIADWGMIVLLQKPYIQQYFIARWLIRKIQESVKSNNSKDFIIPFLKYCNTTVITDYTTSAIKEYWDNRCYVYADYLRNIFNNLIETKFFSSIEEMELICVFVNLWKIVKTLNGKEDSVYKENMREYSKTLQKIAFINRDRKYADLTGLDLSYMDFSDMDLSETCFYNVNFSHSNFQSANLDAICWSGSDLSYSNFDFAFMECSHMEDCNCRYATFRHAHLLSSVVSGADFSYVDLGNTNFMECDADRIIVKGLKINDKTAVNETDFRYVNWEDVDISGLSISENQISHFWEVVNYTRNTILYDAKFRKLDNADIQNVIFKELKASSLGYLEKTQLSTDVNDIFISYASEEKQQYAFPIYHALRNHQPQHSVWIDDENLNIGSQLRREIESVIRYCKLIIIVYSEHYARKGWTRYELLRSLQEYEKRKVNIIVLNIMDNNKTIDLNQELCEKIPRENLYDINRIDEVIEKLLVRVEALL